MKRIILLALLFISCKTIAVTFEPYLPKPDECIKDFQVLERLKLYRDYFWETTLTCQRADKCQAEDLLFDRVQDIISEATKNDTKCKLSQASLRVPSLRPRQSLHHPSPIPENLPE